MIIFDEKKYAEKILEEGFSRFMSLKDLIILSKYYSYLNNSSIQIKKNLIGFCKKYNPEFNNIIWDWKIDKAISSGKKYGLRFEQKVNISKKEIEFIKTLKNYKLEKILFVMIVVAKFFRRNKNELYINANIGDIFNLAKIRADRTEKNQMIYKLNTAGYIKATLVGSFKIELDNIDNKNDNDDYIVVDDFDNIVSFYPVTCISCGIAIINKSKRHDFCDNCYKDFRKEDVRNNVQKYRKNTKNNDM